MARLPHSYRATPRKCPVVSHLAWTTLSSMKYTHASTVKLDNPLPVRGHRNEKPRPLMASHSRVWQGACDPLGKTREYDPLDSNALFLYRVHQHRAMYDEIDI